MYHGEKTGSRLTTFAYCKKKAVLPFKGVKAKVRQTSRGSGSMYVCRYVCVYRMHPFRDPKVKDQRNNTVLHNVHTLTHGHDFLLYVFYPPQVGGKDKRQLCLCSSKSIRLLFLIRNKYYPPTLGALLGSQEMIPVACHLFHVDVRFDCSSSGSSCSLMRLGLRRRIRVSPVRHPCLIISYSLNHLSSLYTVSFLCAWVNKKVRTPVSTNWTAVRRDGTRGIPYLC